MAIPDTQNALHAVMVGVLLLLPVAGCHSRPTLTAARFLDENQNGRPEEGETIRLTFSAPVDLREPEASRGVSALPANASLGLFYKLRDGPNKYQLDLLLGKGDLRLEVEGWFGNSDDREATGITLDYAKLGCLYDSHGNLMQGTDPPVDLSRHPHPPARLQSATWIDRDRNHSVSRGDAIRLTFDRQVRLSENIKQRNGRIPPGLFLLPVAGDRFDDGDQSAGLENAGTEIRIVLGNRPQLTPYDGFQRQAANLPGDPSGIAINGTSIRPHPAIVDDFGIGVRSLGAIDIDVDGQGEAPFQSAVSFLTKGESIHGHTVTPFPDGRLLVAGGRIDASPDGEVSRVSQSGWIYVPESKKWIEVELTKARWGHTTTILPGPDLTYETDDDFVLVVAGSDGNKAHNNLEVLLVDPREGDYAFEPLYSPGLHPRYGHTAHPIPDTNRVLLVGGQQDRQTTLVATVQMLELVGADPREAKNWKSVDLEPLRFPRVYHQSLLYPRENPRVVFVFGGLGQEGSQGTVSAFLGNVLEAPEIIPLREGSPRPGIVVEDAACTPGPRRGHRMVHLEEERWDLLIVGGTAASLVGTPRSDPCDSAYRAEIDLGSDSPRIRYRPAGTLTRHRYDFGTAVLPSGEVLVGGGAEGGFPTAEVELFNPETDHFERFRHPFLAPRQSPHLAPSGNDWFIIGGRGAPAPLSVERFRWLE